MSQKLDDVINFKGSVTDGIKDVDRSELINGTDVAVIDKDWFDIRMLPGGQDMDPIVRKNRFHSTASDKYFDSRLGGNIGINPKAQFSDLVDIRGHSYDIDDILKPEKLGRYYSEVHDDNSVLLKMTMGVHDFASLPDYLFSAIDYKDSYVANKGVLPTGYDFGSVVGSGVMLAAFPMMTILIWGLKFASSLAFDTGPLQYYRMKPTMHTYWAGVSQTVTNIVTERGFMAPSLMADKTLANKIGVGVQLDKSHMEAMRELMPELIGPNNYIDVFAIANRAEVLHNKRLYREKELYDRGESSEYDFLGYVYDKDNNTMERKSAGSTTTSNTNYNVSFTNFLKKVTGKDGLYGSDKKKAVIDKDIPVSDTKYTKDSDGRYPNNPSTDKLEYAEKLAAAIDAGIKDGGQYANFYVKHIGTVTETFTNGVSDIGSGSKLNSVAKGARDIEFSLGGGKILGDTVSKIYDTGKNVIAGTLNSMSFGLGNVLQTLTGNAYVNIPKKWDNSTVSLSNVTYRIELRPTYNTPFSQIKDVDIPYAMILNTVLPLSAGASSHTSPFLCQTHCQGIQEYDLAMVTNVSVKRGVSNLSFDKNNQAQGIDIDITITDLAPLVSMSVNTSIFDSFKVGLEDSTPLGRYIRTLTSRPLLESKYMVPKIKRKAARLLMAKDQMLSASSAGMLIGNSLTGILGGVVEDHAVTLNNLR